MSIAIVSSTMDNAVRKKINKELPIKIENNKYNPNAPPQWIIPFLDDGETTVIPFSYGARVLKIPRPLRKRFTETRLKFEGSLRDEQLVVRNETADIISKKGSVMISAYCGFGKSILAVNLAVAIGFSTLIIVHTVPLMRQWERSILDFCPSARVVRVTTKSVYKPADFYIINAQNAKKKGRDFFKNVGLVVVDEAHKIMAATLSQALQYVQPRYLIGLSATPYRPDGLDKLLTLYFGSHPKIIRKLWKEHTAYIVRTGIIPKLEKTITGKLNWNVVLDSVSMNHDRNELIIKIIMSHLTRTFMVLTKRVAQGDYLEARLKASGVSVTSLMRSKQEFDVTAQVLIGTVGKIGTGFDHQALDALILASDVQEYFIQFLGRCMRRVDVVPIVFDLVDNHRTLEKHYDTRKGVYLEHGGTIVNFNRNKLI